LATFKWHPGQSQDLGRRSGPLGEKSAVGGLSDLLAACHYPHFTKVVAKLLPLIAFGHSHAHSLRRASSDPSIPRAMSVPVAGSRAFPGYLTHENRPISIVWDSIRTLVSQTGEKVVFGSAFFGNEHTRLGLAERSEPFELVHPTYPVLLEDRRRRIIPVAAIRAAISERLEPLKFLFEVLRRREEIATIMQFSSPPPTSSNARVETIVQSNGCEAGHPILRLKLWYCQQDVLQELCSEFDAILVEPPRSLLASGFLQEKYSRDGVHGTTQYGRSLLAMAHDILQERGL